MRGALVQLASSVFVPNYYYGATPPAPPYTYLHFGDTPFFDTDGFYDTVNKDRLKVPVALDGAWAIVKIGVRWTQIGGSKVQILPTLVSGGLDYLSAYPACAPDNRQFLGGTTTDHSSETHPIQLHADDYFRAAAWQVQNAPNGPPLELMSASFSIRIL